jgi:hypothetical protein
VSAYTLQIICLANSRKLLGRCVAGKIRHANGTFGDWIRPVSDRADKALSAYDTHYEGSIDPSLLDVMNITFLKKDPHDHQPENHLIDPNFYWGHLGKVTFSQATGALDPPQSDLWGLSLDSSYHGRYDRVLLSDAAAFNYSLRLIAVADLNVRVCAESAKFGDMKKKLRGYFTYAKHNYALRVTDPIMEGKYLPMPEDTYTVGSALLCVSLGEPHGGYDYKLIAGVILPP